MKTHDRPANDFLKRTHIKLLTVVMLCCIFLIACGGGGGGVGSTNNQNQSTNVVDQQGLSTGLLSATPAHGKKGVSLGTKITVQFYKPVDLASVNSSTFVLKEANNTVSGTIVCDPISQGSQACLSATFTPSSYLGLNTTYNATLTTGIRQLNGSSLLTSDYKWSFTTLSFTKCTSKSQAVTLPSASVSRAEYISLVQAVAAEYGQWADAKSSIDQLAGSSTQSIALANVGTALSMKGANLSAVYATALSALKDPDDAWTASNLGVLLSETCDYTTAKKLLLYGEALTPNAPLFVVNQGWLHYNAGDDANAKIIFGVANASSPDLPPATLGLGLIADRQGDKNTAANYLRQSLSKEYSEEGAMTYLSAVEALTEAGNPPLQPISTEKALDGIVLPDFPISTIESTAAHYAQVKNIEIDFAQRSQASSKDMLAMQQTLLQKQWYYNGINYTDFLLNDVQRVYLGQVDRASNAAWDSFLGIQADLNSKLTAIGYGPGTCDARTSAYKRAYQDGYLYWSKYYAAARPALLDYYAYSRPLLARVYSLPSNQHRNLLVKQWINVHYYDISRMSSTLAMYAALWKQEHMNECTPPPLPSPTAVIEPVVINETPAVECPLSGGPYSASMGPISLELSCESFSMGLGGGVFSTGYERNFVEKETTVFIGVGASLGVPGLGAGAAVGVTLTGGSLSDIDQGRCRDVGIRSEAATNLFGSQSAVSGRWTLQSGPEIAHQIKSGF